MESLCFLAAFLVLLASAQARTEINAAPTDSASVVIIIEETVPTIEVTAREACDAYIAAYNHYVPLANFANDIGSALLDLLESFDPFGFMHLDSISEGIRNACL